jgi:UDP-N-acetylglucosamine 2-epimerase (non-hydrolysing)
MRVLSVFGTRPEAVKLAPVLRALARAGAPVESRVCSTGQQRELVRQTVADLGLALDLDLDLMRPRQDPLEFCARALAALGDALARVAPDVVLVQGDTTTALAGALAAVHRRLPVAHVEAGLRTHDDARPFPEEVNRRLIDQVARIAFAPTPRAAANLRREGIDANRIRVTGNTAIDSLLETVARLPPARSESRTLLVTAHRRESFGAGMRAICDAVARVARARPETRVRFVTHPNPEAGGVARARLGGLANVALLEPLDYTALVCVLRGAHLVLTDSGGLQEEAPWFGKPVLVLREVTERPEGVEAGVAQLVGTDAERIVAAVLRLLDDPSSYARMARPLALYGDGRAGERIVSGLMHLCGLRAAPPEPFVPGPAAQARTREAIDA